MALLSIFPVTPYGFYLDDFGSPNAFATPESLTPAGPDGTIIFGVTLLSAELSRDSGIGFSIPAIFAHEFGHIFQFDRGEGLPAPAMELHADFLAGWYLAARSQWSPTDIGPALRSFFEKGDYEFNSPQHHGTPEQRLHALMEGVNCGARSASSAFDLGLAAVG
jgi:hypothetical protein